MSLIYYNSYDIFMNPLNKNRLDSIPGGHEYSTFFEIFSQQVCAIDRTEIIEIPIKTKILDFLKLPEFIKFDKSFEQICDERARQLLDHANRTNRKIAVMYSGGVDSTTVICSLLKMGTPQEIKNILVLLSDHSVREYEKFYYNYIVKNLNCVCSMRFPYFLGNDDYLIVSGENADQLFGSQMTTYFKKEDLYKPIIGNEGIILDVFRSRVGRYTHKNTCEVLFLLFEKLIKSAPVNITNIYQFLWWINFTMKWQSVYVRILPYTINQNTLKLEENYTTFYSTKEFQLWSMNNYNKYMNDTSEHSKNISKQYSIDFTKDTDYIKKTKTGSLSNIVKAKETLYSIDENLNFSKDFIDEKYYNFKNSFVSKP